MHEQFLLAALEQAKLGLGHCAPNPSVGAVAVQNGKIIAQAWHRGAGTPHAEHLLLAQITPKTPGVSLYITLEPCNHWGRTPPCVDAIINHGIEEVIFSYLDPNPIVAENDSTAKLRAHGIKVTFFPLSIIEEFYASYRYWVSTGLPRVTVKMAHTLDGKIAGPNGERIQLSNELCAEFTHEQRAKTDVILTTSKTILGDNPKLNARLIHSTVAKPVAILDSQLSLNPDAFIFSTAKHCHIFHSVSKKCDYPNSSYYSITNSDGQLDLLEVFKYLGSKGYHDVWVEAGGTLFTALHKQGLVHRTYLYIVPKNLGQNALSAYQSNDLFEREHTVSWHVMGNNVITCVDWQEVMCLPD